MKTDAKGRAVVDVKVPDNLTRYRIIAIAVAGERQFGKGENALTARLPLMIRPSPPRFLNFGDTFQLPVVVQNQTDAPMTVKVAVRASNAAITDGAGREVTVPANDRVEVRFPAAAALAGTARFQIVAAGSASSATQGSGRWSDAAELALPVSPLSITERVFDLVLAQNPKVAPFVIGGDHSTAWPVVSALSRARQDRWAIVQPDAHTDLLETRLGVKYCFATWSYHANELLGRDGRLVQVGTRASGKDRAYWESTLGVRQLWAADCLRDPEGSLDAVIAHLKAVGATSVYFSNDIDGTDESFADATGTPEPRGLTPDWLFALIRRLGAEIGLLGGDIMEVAPPLGRAAGSAQATTELAARYLRATIAATLGSEI